eukprot:TRINITY_DN5031_c0_g1_i1.p1 TRINITY_DN5031_c0_g1~~TRINITY_DN5031_c0_g1_i1.p1  ORF type:complete len:223 (+),score=51.32 TRINITY_DN5031_c0_g1_i1:29-670(+)
MALENLEAIDDTQQLSKRPRSHTLPPSPVSMKRRKVVSRGKSPPSPTSPLSPLTGNRSNKQPVPPPPPPSGTFPTMASMNLRDCQTMPPPPGRKRQSPPYVQSTIPSTLSPRTAGKNPLDYFTLENFGVKVVPDEWERKDEIGVEAREIVTLPTSQQFARIVQLLETIKKSTLELDTLRKENKSLSARFKQTDSPRTQCEHPVTQVQEDSGEE